MVRNLLLLGWLMGLTTLVWAQQDLPQVMALADTAKYGISPARLRTQYTALYKYEDAMAPAQRTTAVSVVQQFDRSRFEFLEKQGTMSGYGFAYECVTYYGTNGMAQWVTIAPYDDAPSEKLMRELIDRLTRFYRTNPLQANPGKSFYTSYVTFFGRPQEKRKIRTGDSTISTLEAARLTTRPDTVRYVFFNQLALTTVPDVLYRFPNLEELDLSKNRLTQLPARLTTDLLKLTKLSLLFNQISDDSVFFQPNTHLKALTLQGNKLTRIPAAVRYCRHLESLWMGNSELKEFNVKPLRRLKRLTDLNLYNAGLTSLPKKIRKLKHLRALDLYYNSLTQLPKQMGKMRSLQELALAYNKLTVLPPQLARLRNLHTLYVHHNAISQLPDTFAKLTALQTLDIGYNQFSDVPVVLSGMINLESVDVSGNNLQTLPTLFVSLKNLKKLYLRSNPITHDDAKTGPYAQLLDQMEANKTEVFY